MRISIFLCLFIILYPGWSLGDERCSSAVWGADDQLGAVNRITPRPRAAGRGAGGEG